MRTKGIKICLNGIILWLFIGTVSHAQEIENVFQSRYFAEVEFKPVKKIKIYVSPEIRLDEHFDVTKYFIESGLSYKVVKNTYLSGSYRFVAEPGTAEIPTVFEHRFELSASYKNDIAGFEPAFRLAYTNYSDDDDENGYNRNFLKFRSKLAYDIPHFKLTPYLSAEFFYNLNDRDAYKMRYAAGGKYKLFKNNYLNVGYKLDYYLRDYKNKYILNIGYTLKF